MMKFGSRTATLFALTLGFAAGFSGSVSALEHTKPLFLAEAGAQWSEFLPPEPFSDFLEAAPGEPSVDFCSDWNPEFAYRGYRCCGSRTLRLPSSYSSSSRSRRKARVKNTCAPNRIKWTFCDEMTADQREYREDLESGRIPDALAHIDLSLGRTGAQAFCTTDNGFLANGRPLMPSEKNRIEIRNVARCTNFGTDPMVGSLEWVGREIKKEYSGEEYERARLVVGDLAAPRGGCIAGRGGRRAHKSHTSGVDADITFFNPVKNRPPEERFTRTMNPESNWWLLKKIFSNPYACVKIVFVDRKHIKSLAKEAKNDPEWQTLSRFIRHAKGHRDHFHIRVGEGPGVPGCMVDTDLEEPEDSSDDAESPADLEKVEAPKVDEAGTEATGEPSTEAAPKTPEK